MSDDLYTQKPPTVRAMQWDGTLDSVEDLVNWGEGRFTAQVAYTKAAGTSTHKPRVKIVVNTGFGEDTGHPKYILESDYIIITDDEVIMLPEQAFEMRYQKAKSTERV